MPTYLVDVNPDVLIWARQKVGLSIEEASAKLHVRPVTLRFWEVGADELSMPTLVQLRGMARLYNVPLGAFYFAKPPDEPAPTLPDYRLLRAGETRDWSLEMHATFQRVQMQREVAIELAQAADETPDPLSIHLSMGDDPEEAAERVRSWLGISHSEQVSWRNDYQALRAWSSAIELHDILVAQSSRVPREEMRGFSIGEQPFPVIVLNGYEKPRPKIFTLLHELVHVLLRSSSLCDISDALIVRSTKEQTESFCNHIAGAVLLSSVVMREELATLGISRPVAWSDSTLWQLANRYHVSREVVLRRMVNLGRATLDYYFQKLHQYSQQYDAELQRDKSGDSGGPNSSVLKLRNLGRRYSSDVLRAYSRRDINAAELSDYLDANVDQIPKLVSLLERQR